MGLSVCYSRNKYNLLVRYLKLDLNVWPSPGPNVAIVNAWSECGEASCLEVKWMNGLELDGIPDRSSAYRQSTTPK